MKIVIIGAGNAGRHLASTLAVQRHDVTVIDQDPDRLADLEDLDLMVLEGAGTAPSVLERAGISKTELLVAVTNHDEVNILACAYAKACGVPYKVARVNNPDYTSEGCKIELSSLGVDLAVSHKDATITEIFNIVRMPGSHEVIDLLGGGALALGLKIQTTSPLITAPLKSFPNQDLLRSIRFIAVIRGEELFIPDGNTQFLIGDDVYVVIAPDKVISFLDWAAPEHPTFQKVIIGGGGDLGLGLARKLEELPLKVVLIEANEEQAYRCSEQLRKTMVLHGDLLDREILMNAGIEENTAFVAVTGIDENNIISCMLAEQEGSSWTLAQVTKPEYVPVINSLSLLDRAVSPHASMTNAILHFVRGQHVSKASLLHNLPGELLEVVLKEGTQLEGRRIQELPLPIGSIVATVKRGDTICPATGDLQLSAGDRLVLFCKPRFVKKLENILKK